MTWWAVRVSSQPADRQHTYGHGKVESLSALVETFLLLLTCVWIVYESVRRLWFSEAPEVLVTGWSFLVVIVSIGSTTAVRALSRAAKKPRARPWRPTPCTSRPHLVLARRLLGLGGVAVARRFEMPWLEKADAAAALGVAVIVIWISYRLGKRSVDALLDAVPRGLHERVTDAAAGVPGVQAVRKVRLRWSGPDAFADVTWPSTTPRRSRRPTTSPIRPRPRSGLCCRGPTWWSTSSRSPPPTRTCPPRSASWRPGWGWRPRHPHLSVRLGRPDRRAAPGGQRVALAGGRPPAGHRV